MKSPQHSTASDVEAAVQELGIAPDAYGPTLNTSVSTGAVERVGRALADAIRPYEPGFVVFWNTSDEAVLAHAVARELGAETARADETEGVVSLSRPITSGSRVVLLATAWAKPMRLETLVSLSRTRAAEVVAVASVLGPPEYPTEQIPLVSLLPQAPVPGGRAGFHQGEQA